MGAADRRAEDSIAGGHEDPWGDKLAWLASPLCSRKDMSLLLDEHTS